MENAEWKCIKMKLNLSKSIDIRPEHILLDIHYGFQINIANYDRKFPTKENHGTIK